MATCWTTGAVCAALNRAGQTSHLLLVGDQLAETGRQDAEIIFQPHE
jgi:hypothetical protein